MTHIEQLREGDRVRVVLEGVVSCTERAGLPYGEPTRRIRLVVGGGRRDAVVVWNAITAAPQITVLATAYRSGDVAVITPHGPGGIRRRAIFVRTGGGREYWMDEVGSTWSNLAPVNIEVVSPADDSEVV